MSADPVPVNADSPMEASPFEPWDAPGARRDAHVAGPDAERRDAPRRSGVFRLVPLTRAQARVFVAAHHRHSEAPIGDVFRVGLDLDGMLVGVAIAGRPAARLIDDGETLEITRVCVVDGRRECMLEALRRRMPGGGGARLPARRHLHARERARLERPGGRFRRRPRGRGARFVGAPETAAAGPQPFRRADPGRRA